MADIPTPCPSTSCSRTGNCTSTAPRKATSWTPSAPATREPGDWWYHVKSVICFGRVRILADDADRLARLRSLGKKYFPDGYDTEADIVKNGPRAEMLEFTIDHLSGKAVREK